MTEIAHSLSQMQDEVFELNKSKGWYDTDRTFGEDMMLLSTEVTEAFEAWRRWGLDDMTEIIDRPNEVAKPQGVGSEFADIFIRLLDSCERAEVNLEYEYYRKMAYNKTRPYRHGGRRV